MLTEKQADYCDSFAIDQINFENVNVFAFVSFRLVQLVTSALLRCAHHRIHPIILLF